MDLAVDFLGGFGRTANDRQRMMASGRLAQVALDLLQLLAEPPAGFLLGFDHGYFRDNTIATLATVAEMPAFRHQLLQDARLGPMLRQVASDPSCNDHDNIAGMLLALAFDHRGLVLGK